MDNHALQVRDPVHDFIGLTAAEASLLDTQTFQRLRGIRQLALASLVYPGALHTRFDHSLGVMHVAGEMAEQLGLDNSAVELLRLAALLHDIGHGPFSHVSEHALERFSDRSSLSQVQKLEKIHEVVTASIITGDSQISRVLGKQRCQEVAALLGEGYGEAVLRAVVSGPLDADKQDYLLRDSYFCGVRYGIFDLRQFHRSLEAVRHGRSREIMLRPERLHAVEQYALAKYYMTANVYRHKVRLITDQMIVRAIVLGILTDEIDELRKLYRFDGSETFIQNYMQWDDARFMQTFASDRYAGTQCHAMLQRLQQRKLLKRVFRARMKDLGAAVREAMFNPYNDQVGQERRNIEAVLAEQISRLAEQNVSAGFVILHAFGIKSVKEMARNDEATMLVWKPQLPVPFEQESALFASIQEGFDEEFVEVYAPIEWPSKAARADTCDRIAPAVIDALEHLASSQAPEE